MVTKEYLRIPSNVQVVEAKARPTTVLDGSGTEYTFNPMGTQSVGVRRIKGRRKEEWVLPVTEARELYRQLLSNGFYRW